MLESILFCIGLVLAGSLAYDAGYYELGNLLAGPASLFLIMMALYGLMRFIQFCC